MGDAPLAMEQLDRLVRRVMAAVTPRGRLPSRDPEHTWQLLEGFEDGLGRDLLVEKLLDHALDCSEIDAAFAVLDSRRLARGSSAA